MKIKIADGVFADIPTWRVLGWFLVACVTRPVTVARVLLHRRRAA